MYQVFVDEDKVLDQPAHVRKACSWGAQLAESSQYAKTFVGEWSAATDICAYPDGHTEAGATCNVDGCQCQGNTGSDEWSQPMVDAVRSFMEAQLDTFENNASGFFFWSFKGPGAWSFLSGVKDGWIPQPLDERKFPGQCDGNVVSRVKRGLGGRA